MPHKDYSATPLATKLGIKGTVSVLIVNAPNGFTAMLEPWPDGARLVPAGTEGIDVAVVFSTQLDTLLQDLPELAESIAPRRALVDRLAEEGFADPYRYRFRASAGRRAGSWPGRQQERIPH